MKTKYILGQIGENGHHRTIVVEDGTATHDTKSEDGLETREIVTTGEALEIVKQVQKKIAEASHNTKRREELRKMYQMEEMPTLESFIRELLTSRDTSWKERVRKEVEYILDSHIEMARDSLKNAVADQVAPYKHQFGRLLQAKSEILNILSDN